MKLVALGGLGEFGANSTLIESESGDRILIDAGVAFSELEPYGVAFEVPDFGSLEGPRPLGIVCTHGHDDHLKGVPFALDAFGPLPVLGSAATLARLDLEGTPDLRKVRLDGSRGATLGPWSIDAIEVSHSIPGALFVRLSSTEGRLVVATDFRLAPSALGEETRQDALDRWAAEGVDVLLLDSTNALQAAAPPSEVVVAATIERLVAGCRGAVVGVTFASHVGRCRQLVRAAIASGRVAVAVGRGLMESLEVQARLGGLGLPPGALRPARDLPSLAHEKLLLIATGSQGEPGSAFSRLAVDKLTGFTLAPGDLVLHAARMIPGNERHLEHLFDHCLRRGADVVTASEETVHASGHPHRAELEALLRRLAPKAVLPVHGRRRNLAAVASMAREAGAASLVVENGGEVEWSGGVLAVTGTGRGVGRLLVAEDGEETLDPVVVRSRRLLARDGVVACIVRYDKASRRPAGEPELACTGLVLDGDTRRALLRGLVAELARVPPGESEDLRSTMAQWLRHELRRRARRQPIVLSLVVEL